MRSKAVSGWGVGRQQGVPVSVPSEKLLETVAAWHAGRAALRETDVFQVRLVVVVVVQHCLSGKVPYRQCRQESHPHSPDRLGTL